MKPKERKITRELRSHGWSLRAIVSYVKCSKSTVSRWIQDIPLSNAQITRLKSNQDKGRAKAANHPNSPKNRWQKIRSDIIRRAIDEIPIKYSLSDLRNIGAALYWAEGYTASRNSIIFANTDPRMIQLMMLFFRKVCKVPESKFRGKICIHPHLDIKKAERYWSKASRIPLKQFNKPLLAVSRASKQKRNTLPFGTFFILIGDVYVCSRIKGWIEGMACWTRRADSSVG